MQFSFLVFDSKTGSFPWFCLSLHTQFGHRPWIVCLSLHIWKCWDMPSHRIVCAPTILGGYFAHREKKNLLKYFGNKSEIPRLNFTPAHNFGLSRKTLRFLWNSGFSLLGLVEATPAGSKKEIHIPRSRCKFVSVMFTTYTQEYIIYSSPFGCVFLFIAPEKRFGRARHIQTSFGKCLGNPPNFDTIHDDLY